MIFGPTPLDEARGAILAHTTRLPNAVLKKGTVLDAGAIAALRAAGHREVVAARLEPGDVPEDEAADRLANAVIGPLLSRTRAATGRVNLLAETAGLLRVNAACVDRLNALDESLTVATLPDHSPVAARDMVATIKVIPFAAPGNALSVAEAMLRGSAPIALHPYRSLKVGLVATELPGMKPGVMDKGIEVTRERIEALAGILLPPNARRTRPPPPPRR
ncbi:hypothetical protein ACE7GA_21160 [Roseomonas sp. CCTCC AB2023176]|uniref:hypothetical protein n=1 Tax=Roseomonas sp. CCTCC AB2023176 TaxID=3342640 RepID=UPI0035E1FC78